jgi:hypothetical protein
MTCLENLCQRRSHFLPHFIDTSSNCLCVRDFERLFGRVVGVFEKFAEFFVVSGRKRLVACSNPLGQQICGAEEVFLRESTVRINNFLQPAISIWNLNRWISMRSEILGGTFSAVLGWYLVYSGGVHRGPTNVGFSLSAAVLLSSPILSWVQITNALQSDGMHFFDHKLLKN